jgi:hypothetical protein
VEHRLCDQCGDLLPADDPGLVAGLEAWRHWTEPVFRQPCVLQTQLRDLAAHFARGLRSDFLTPSDQRAQGISNVAIWTAGSLRCLFYVFF